ncbi:MAG: rRNA pseudouridine synthase [Candidatus Adiutrix sp.]|nr:rRNA pseudouridine synthase [Candidatus Adiutrix sp.]
MKGQAKPEAAGPGSGRRPDKAPAAEGDGRPRLQKIIAGAGWASRRGAEKLMAEGRVTVNGRAALEPGFKADPERDEILVDGRRLPRPRKLSYYLFHKPAGCLTTLSDPQGRPTIKPYLDRLPVRVYPVGRLDMDVEGLLILTNDGELARRLMHPSTHVPKVYRVKVAGRPSEAALEKLRHGRLMLGRRAAAPARAELIKSAEDRAWILLTLTEGRRRQVKRMCSAIGHPVLKLKRVAYGGLELGSLRREAIRPLSPAELRTLIKSCRSQDGELPALIGSG